MSGSPKGFVIEHPKITLEVAIERLDRIHIHEEIIDYKMGELVEKIPSDGVFIHPIIVDKKSLVVLDGMHRVAAAKQIGFDYIPVCLVDYMNPNIKISCWYRLFKTAPTIEEVKAVFKELGFKTSEKSYSEAEKLVWARKALTAYFTGGNCIVADAKLLNIKERYDAIKKVELRLEAAGHRMGYATEADAPKRIESGEYHAGLMTPPVTKEEVIDIGLRGQVFSQKTTRHIIPARPMFVSVPIEWLRESVSLDAVNWKLKRYLATKTLTLHPGGMVIDRRYDEPLYFFE